MKDVCCLRWGRDAKWRKSPPGQPVDIYFDPPPRELACQRTRGLAEWRATGRGVPPPAVHGKSKSMGKITTDAAAGMTIGAVSVSQRCRRGHIKRPVAQPTGPYLNDAAIS